MVQHVSIPQDLLRGSGRHVVLFPSGGQVHVPTEPSAPSTGCPVHGLQALVAKCSPRGRRQRDAVPVGVALEISACARS